MSARALLISIAFFFLLINVRSAFVSKPVFRDFNAGHGSYGVTASHFVPDESSNPKVFFMGNSVYYGTELIPELAKLNANSGPTYQIGNFGFTGAAIYDYIHNYRHLRKFDPDLIVAQFNPTSLGYAGPYYRNDGYKLSLRPSNLHLYSEDFIRATVTKEDVAEMLCYSVSPLAKVSKLDRSWMNQKLKTMSRKFTKLQLWTFFPNKLNAVGEWATNRKQLKSLNKGNEQEQSVFDPGSGPINKQEYKTAEEALLYFVEQLKADNRKAIFVLQPSDFSKLPLMQKMESILAAEPLISFADHHDFYDAKIYIDKIHPNLEGAKLAARRHQRLIAHRLSQ